MTDKQIKNFIYYYSNGYQKIPAIAMKKAGLIRDLHQPEAFAMFERVMADKRVVAAIAKFEKEDNKRRKRIQTQEEALQRVSNAFIDASLYKDDRDVTDLVGMVKLFGELAKVQGWNAPIETKNETKTTVVDAAALKVAQQEIDKKVRGL